MAAATVLYVGDDFCHRIPVMESTGIVVLHAECSVGGVRKLLVKDERLSAVTFHNDLFPPPIEVVSTARELARAPLILLRNPAIECDEKAFDAVIDVDFSPTIWTKSFEQAIAEAHRIQKLSRQLQRECEAVREACRGLREISARNCKSPVDYDALFRAEGNEPED